MLYYTPAFTVPQRLDFAHHRLAPLWFKNCLAVRLQCDLIVVADRGKFTRVFLHRFGVLVEHLIHSCYFISPNKANIFPNLCTLIAEHEIRICLAGVSVFCSIMGNNCVISSTDVCAVTLRYMRVLLIDLQINVCVRRNSFIPRHGTQYCYHVSVLNLALHHVLSHCRPVRSQHIQNHSS